MKVKQPKCKFRHVMLLDDNELDNFINEKIIEANNFSEKVYVNSSGRSALEFLTNLNATGSTSDNIYPEAIFIDINMPMMDGFQFINNLKKLPGGTPKDCKLIILTSSIYPEDKNKAMDISKDIIFLNKPLTKEMLSTI
jgi:CheY-like chemotaxis protein